MPLKLYADIGCLVRHIFQRDPDALRRMQLLQNIAFPKIVLALALEEAESGAGGFVGDWYYASP